MRLNWTDYENFSGQFELWQANCRRSLKGRRGQAALRELIAALNSLPEKRLIHGSLCKDGDVCAVGAIALQRRVHAGEERAAVLSDLEANSTDEWGESEETDEYAAGALGLPRLVAWKIVEQNDIINDDVWEVHHGPVRPHHASYKGWIAHVRPMTPEERYERILAWAKKQLVRKGEVKP